MTTTPEFRTVREPSVLRGRDTHLEAVEAGLAAAHSARGQVLLIEGGSGTGKTRLLREANDRARRAGTHTRTGQAFDGQQVLPFAPLLTAVLNGEPPIARPDTLGTLGTHPDLPYRVVRDLRTALESAAARAPVAVLLDDLQWADNATIMAVRALTADLRHTGVLWMLTTRGDTTPAVRELWDHLAGEGACRLGLPPLTLEMTAQLVADAAGAPAHPGLLALADQARGNPFFILELVRGLGEEDRLRIQDGLATAIGSRLPARLTGNINQRLGRLSAPARKTVRMAAVLPQRFTAAQLAAMLRCRPSELVEPLEEAVEADLVRGDGERLQFQHDLLRQAVRESLPASLRRALEREVADVLVDPAVVAELNARARDLLSSQDGDDRRRATASGLLPARMMQLEQPDDPGEAQGFALPAQRDTRMIDLRSQFAGLSALADGRLADARTHIESVAPAHDEAAAGTLGATLRMITYAGIARHSGESGLALEAVRSARQMRRAAGPAARRWATRVLAESRAADDPAAAARLLDDDPLLPTAPPLPADHDFLAFAARLATVSGDETLTARVRAAAARLVEDSTPPTLFSGVAAYLHGVLDRDAERLEAAAQLLRSVRRPLLAAAALEQAGQVLAGRGRTSAATTRRQAALETFAACGAAADVERISCLLHGRDERGRPPDRRAAFGWSSLTDTEHRVIRLIASGITNRQAARQLSLSPHTVNTHLRHVFAKLDINSRVQLANLAHDFPD